MPFKSEAQRKYLWANEPGIARDWTDKHGSGIAKALGGRIGYNRGRVVNPGGYAGELSGSELFLKLYQEGKIDNLQLAMEDAARYDAGEKTNYEKLTGKDPLEIYQGNLDGIEGHPAAADNTEPFLDIDNITMKDKQLAANRAAMNVFQQGHRDPNIFQRAIGGIKSGINRANEYNRAYNDTTGLNTNYYAGSLHGNIDNAARIGRRNQGRVNNLIGNYIAGKNKMTPLGLRNRINFLGTNQQKQTFADAIARKTHSPHANYDYWEGQGVNRADITADVTGMYTDDSSGIGNPSAPTATDDWGDVDGVSYIAKGGLTQRAPRGSYLNGGLASLWPR